MGKQVNQPQPGNPSNRQGGSKHRLFDPADKVVAAQRLLAGESATALCRELQIRRSVLYRWRDTYRREGPAGLQRQPGRPPGRGQPAAPAGRERPAAAGASGAQQRIAELQRKVGQQALEIDFLARAFKRVKDLDRPSGGSGASRSTAKSAPGSTLKDD